MTRKSKLESYKEPLQGSSKIWASKAIRSTDVLTISFIAYSVRTPSHFYAAVPLPRVYMLYRECGVGSFYHIL